MLRPFENETDTAQIGELTIENRLDRLTLYGNVDLTRDQDGLAKARQLQSLLNQVVAAMEADPVLPEQVSIIPPEVGGNPFS